MPATELITGMGELVNHIRELEEENKKLKEGTLLKFQEVEIADLKEEIKELREENKKLKIPDGVVRAFKGLVVNWWEDEEKYYRENFHMKEKYDGDPGNIPTKYLSDCNYTDLRILDDWIVGGKYEKYEIEESEEEDSESEEESDDEELSKYEKDDSGWDRAYGYTIKDGEYRINISGGGDHWEDYVITKNGCFIHNKEGKKKVFTFVSCPEGNYIKVWDTPHMEGGLVLDEGESDMYEMVKECYEEEIMNYDSESEEESDDEDLTGPESDKP